MTPYKGIIKITCKAKAGACPRKLRDNVKATCMDCPEAVSQILDLDDKVIFEHKEMPQSHQGTKNKKTYKKP